jgi:hypothetical protein
VGVARRHVSVHAAVWLAAVSVLAAGCGGEPRRTADDAQSKHRDEVASDAYALTCGDLARQPETSTNQRLVIHAEFALAQEPILRERVAEMTLNRAGRSVYWALTAICKGRPQSFKPARAAVHAVHDGKYLVQPRPESWSHPEHWSRSVVKELSGD